MVVHASVTHFIDSGGETIFIEDFEDANVDDTVSHPDNLANQGNYDYYGRLDANNLPSNLNYSY